MTVTVTYARGLPCSLQRAEMSLFAGTIYSAVVGLGLVLEGKWALNLVNCNFWEETSF